MALPERHYDLLASLLLQASRDRGAGDPQEVLEKVGHDFGFEVGLAEVAAGRATPGAPLTQAVEGVVRLLSRYGFAARLEGEGSLRACACPFEELAFHDPERICGLDRAIWRGMLVGAGPRGRPAGLHHPRPRRRGLRGHRPGGPGRALAASP